MKSSHNIALGFYQNIKTAKNVFEKLKKNGLKRIAMLHRDRDGKVKLRTGLFFRVDSTILKKLKDKVISDDTLIIVQAASKDVSKALSILRHVESGHPVSYLLRVNDGPYKEKEMLELIKEPLTIEEMQDHAAFLANELKDVFYSKKGGTPLLTNLKRCEKSLTQVRYTLAEAEFVEQTVTLSAEWLLDNTYVIQGNIEEVQRNLPKKFYKELPKIAEGPSKGQLRIYVIAKDIVNCTANRITRENLINYLNSYQKNSFLTIAELWVLPLMLRIRLIESLEILSIDIDRRLMEGEYAGFWGNRLLNVSRREKDRLGEFLIRLKTEVKNPSPHFAEELMDHLHDDENIMGSVKEWAEAKLRSNIQDIIKNEQLQKSTEQIALSNAIVSLITLSQLSWRGIFESVSVIDRILSKDPLKIYNKMDFPSRDSYRHAIEVLSRGSKLNEGEVASKILHLAENGKGEVESHVGFYLVDSGRKIIEESILYKPTWMNYFRKQIIGHPTAVYVGSAAVITALIGLTFAYLMASWGLNFIFALMTLIFATIAASEISMQFVSMLVTKILHPHVLPKLSFKQEKSIPENFKTLIVIPTLMISIDEIQETVDKLEVRYLANSTDGLIFAVYFDFVDAKEKTLPIDSQYLQKAIEAINHLNKKYGNKFFLLYRERSFNKCEDAWIGNERKRGKLEALNRLIVHKECPETIVKVGDAEDLKSVRYIITLDEDTELPKDTAKQLIETIAHPLNQPRICESGQLTRGYTIIQPRVTTDITRSRNTLFSRIFSDAQSLNPYTQAVSDIYQDLTSEGNYHGKGIYDVQSFHRIVGRLFPENHLLSHDLLEGVHVRVGFASDVILSDAFPEDYYTWTKRQHRWMRGDFQIADWLFNKVPVAGNKKVLNPLSLFNRFKIFDNLRRAFIPIALMSVLLIAFFASVNPIFWASFVTFVFFVPLISLFAFSSLTSLRTFVLSWSDLKNYFLRALINITLLPQQAFLSIDAIVRVFFRRFTGKHLLEWETFKATSSNKKHVKFVIKLFSVSLFAALTLVLVYFYHPVAFLTAIPFTLAWFLSPLIVTILDKHKAYIPSEELSEEDCFFLRNVARRTWRYFDDFVGPQTNWLPPDNYQAALTVEVAQRTSPTNIGLWMLAAVSAYDFKYIDIDDVIDRLYLTFQSFKKLEMYEGHFLNWYDIQNLKPLYPRYVSTVDSGNLLASFWTLEQSVLEIISEPLLTTKILEGLTDSLNLALDYLENNELNDKYRVIKDKINNFKDENTYKLIVFIQEITQDLQKNVNEEDRSKYWFKELDQQLEGFNSTINRYFSWMLFLKNIPDNELTDELKKIIAKVYSSNVSISDLAINKYPDPVNDLMKKLKNTNTIKALSEKLHTSSWLAGERLGAVNEILEDQNALCDGLNMRFLYNEERKLFSIGYHVDDRRLDTSYYDLLASEARIASFVSIAKDEVPLEHWWALGRPYGYLSGKHVLISWGGTMFEYLMPLIFKNYYPDSLIGEGCRNAVDCQIIYGESRGIPWGISESAFSAIDAHRIYQYRSFGVPGLGFKRGLEEDLVISPYSSALALSIYPKKAVNNLKNLTKLALNDYGFYESIDYTRQKTPRGERGVVVYAFMAHHQGMSFLAIDNVLHNNIIRKRFHSNLRVAGMESLLCEKAPAFPPIAKGSRKSVPLSRLAPFPVEPIMGIVDTPHSMMPKVNILSNSAYTVMLTNSGAGYSRYKDIDLTRWRADVTSDCYGSFFYVKDVESGNYWSTSYHPTGGRTKKYSVSFKADRTEIKRLDHLIETQTEVVVSPEDDIEIRLITIANLSPQKRTIEITSYSELVISSHAADVAHPAFNKMFIQTEAVSDVNALLAYRRQKDPNEKQLFVGHVVASNEPSLKPVEFETDRYKFIGRGRSLEDPLAMEGALTNTDGYVLDPIFSLRYLVTLNPGQRVQVSFVTAVSDNKEKTIALLKKYADLSSHHRAIEMAWAHAQLELRHLRIHQEEVQLFQKLASRILYPQGQLRPTTDKLLKNRKGQSGLWAYGISGDLPIVVLSIAEVYEMDLVRQVLTAHVFLHMRNLKFDLVLLNEEASGYEQPLFEELQRLIATFSSQIELNQSGGVFLLNSDQMPEEDRILILAVARVNLIAARGSLRQQLVNPMETITYPSKLTPLKKAKDFPSAALPFVELKFYNEIGGFSPDGREYMIFLSQHVETPMPWVNVIANAQFGTLVSESGVGTTWFGNSQTNRLTPWTNDPVQNNIVDLLYIRDDELGVFWTPTPKPIRELDAYRVRHGQGYTRFEHNSHGIEQDLLVFVPTDDEGGKPLKIQRLKLKNTSNKKRTLSVYSYTELVLGIDREHTQMHVITSWDAESQSLFAVNHYNQDYGNNVVFICSSPLADSYTGNRTEFIGRNSNCSNPTALRRKKLSCHVGAAVDPAAALKVTIDLNIGEEKEVIFVLGCALDEESARNYINQIRSPFWVEDCYQKTLTYWDKTLHTLQVKTPDDDINFSFNRWLLYQNLSCRFWGRTAFYQSSGAFGFRDQLQDSMALLYAEPKLSRDQILLAASRQFEEGDVQHWWHPPGNGGVRTRITDDLLWLPYVTAQYIRVTNDVSILDEEISFITGDLLKEDQHEAYFIPEVSPVKATLLEHCRRALRKGMTEGAHKLPLMGGGDWNDGMNHVGIEGKGESVWLAWFLVHVMNDFADLLSFKDRSNSDDCFRAEAKRLADVINENAWDGKWYKRAYYDDGSPLGSHENIDAKIDCIAQAWAVISKAGDSEKIKIAFESLEEHIIKFKEKMVLLLTPSFDQDPMNPGYIKGYPPGVRENGGQYTHGSLWVPLAYAMRGDGNKSVDILRMMNPIAHTNQRSEAMHFKTEPYALAADVYNLPGQVGRGGWTWYTGSAAWMYRILLENVFGFTLRGDILTLKPVLPDRWNEITLNYRYKETHYDIFIEKSDNNTIELDGIIVKDGEIKLIDDKKTHRVLVKVNK